MRHNEDRIEAVLVLHFTAFRENRITCVVNHDFRPELVHKGLRDIFGDVCPDIDNLIIAFAVGYETLLILIVNILYGCFSLFNEFLFLDRDLHIINRY